MDYTHPYPSCSAARDVPSCVLALPAVQARSLLKDAEGKKKLTKAEAKELESDLRHDINTQFGTRNENFALSVYERRSGTEVGRKAAQRKSSTLCLWWGR